MRDAQAEVGDTADWERCDATVSPRALPVQSDADGSELQQFPLERRHKQSKPARIYMIVTN